MWSSSVKPVSKTSLFSWHELTSQHRWYTTTTFLRKRDGDYLDVWRRHFKSGRPDTRTVHAVTIHFYLSTNLDLEQEMVNKRRRKIQKTGGKLNVQRNEWTTAGEVDKIELHGQRLRKIRDWSWHDEAQRLKLSWGRSETEVDMRTLRDWSWHEKA